MTDTATGEAFTPKAAFQTLQDASRYEESLRQRTEGLTNVIWGLVMPGIFMSYAMAGSIYQDATWPLWTQLLWAPWVAVGVLATTTLWRTAALSAPALSTEVDWKWGLGIMALYLAGIYLAFAVAPGTDPSLLVLLVVGIMWGGMGVFNVWRASRTGRMYDIGLGASIFVTAVVALLVLPETTDPEYLRYVYSTVVAVVASGLFGVGGGLSQALRG